MRVDRMSSARLQGCVQLARMRCWLLRARMAMMTSAHSLTPDQLQLCTVVTAAGQFFEIAHASAQVAPANGGMC